MTSGLSYKPPAFASNAVPSQKLSQITPATTAPALTDQLVGVKGGSIDQLYTLTQVQTAIGSGGSSSLVVGTTPVTGAANNNVLFNNNGVLGAESGSTPFANPATLDGVANHFATYNIFGGTQGPYWVNLNLFNVGALTGFSFGAIAYPETFPGYTTFSWSWPFPGSPLWGYPEIVYGTQGGGAFSNGPANKPTPKRINDLGVLKLIYNLTLLTQSPDDTSYLIETWAQTIPGNQATLTNEILFYAYATPAVSSFILALPTHFNYSVGGFNVYFALSGGGTPGVYMMPVTTPGGTTPLNMAQPGVTYTIDFAALITAALNAGWLTGTNLIGGYEVGFETRENTGSAVFNRLEWQWVSNVGNQQKRIISLPTTFYVTTTGSDITGDGSLATPWATPQHAIDWVADNIKVDSLSFPVAGNPAVTIQIGTAGVAAQTFTLTEPITCRPVENTGGKPFRALAVALVGDPTTPANITLSYTDDAQNNGVITSAQGHTPYTVSGFTLNSGFAGLCAVNVGRLSVEGNLRFTGTGNCCFLAYELGTIEMSGWTAFIDSSSIFAIGGAYWGGVLKLDHSTFNFVRNPTAVTSGIFDMEDVAAVSVASSTFTNGNFVTGNKFNARYGSHIDPHGSNATTLALWPGTTGPLLCDASSSFNGFQLAQQATPSTSNLIAGAFTVFKNPSGGAVTLVYNDAGTLKSVALT